MTANHGRTTARAFELVIAQDVSPCEWSRPYAHRRTVYHKGPQTALGAITLPNVGGDAHTFLTHIVRNYDDLAEVTIFVSSRDERHQPFTTDHFIRDDCDFVATTLHAANMTDPKNVTTDGRLKTPHTLSKGPLYPASLSFGEWFDRGVAFGMHEQLRFKTMSHLFLMCESGTFSVKRSSIVDKPKSYYQSLLNWVSSHQNSEWANYIEHAWIYIFIHATARPYTIGLAGRLNDHINLSATQCTMPRDMFARTFGTYRRAS